MKTGAWFAKALRVAALAVTAVLLLVSDVSAAINIGGLDPTFDHDGKVVTIIRDTDIAQGVVVQPDGKIVAAGYSLTGGDTDFSLARYNTDGSLDSSFDYDGKVVTDIQARLNYGYAVALQPDGRIVVAGTSEAGGDLTLVRYNTDGAPDWTFDYDGIVVTDIGAADDAHAVVIQPNGKIIVGGYSTNLGEMNYALARYNTNGSLDTDFDYDGKVVTDIRDADGIRALALQADGKIVAAGYSGTGGAYDFSLARYNTNGSLDTGFDGDGKVVTDIQGRDNYGHAIAIQPGGKILVGGYTWATGGYDFTLTRYNTNGALDSSFDYDGIVVTDIGGDEEVFALALQQDGKILAAGYSTNYWEPDLALARYNTNGSLDTVFDYDGLVVTTIGYVDVAYAMTLQNDGRIIVAGKTDDHFSLARYFSTPPASYEMSFASTALHDGWVLESGEFSEMGGSLNATGTTFRLGDDVADQQYRAILSFSTGGIPDNAVVTKARLYIRRQGLVGVNPFSTHGNLTIDIRKPFFGSGASLEAVDFQATAGKSSIGKFQKTPITGNWYLANLYASAHNYINRQARTQFRLYFTMFDNDDMHADYLLFYSGNADSGNRPILTVNYILPY